MVEDHADKRWIADAQRRPWPAWLLLAQDAVAGLVFAALVVAALVLA